jgi:HEPN domain-containing protein
MVFGALYKQFRYDYLLEGGYAKGARYYSQQSIEKAIKAVLLKKGWDLEKVHNIERLAAIAEDCRIPLTISEEEVIFIDSIYRGRDPAEAGLLPLGEPSGDDARRSVSLAADIE